MATLQPFQGIQYMPHQEVGIRWMIDREDEPYTLGDDYIYGGILADEMGLGKTISIIGLILNNPVPSTLVVAPLPVLNQWSAIAKQAGLTVFRQTSSGWELVAIGTLTESMYLTNYERIVIAPRATHTKPWDRLVMDEAHKARNHRSQMFEQLISIQATTRWALTGTPIVNKLGDLKNIYRLIGASSGDSLSSAAVLSHVPALMLARDRSICSASMPSDPKVAYINLDFSSDEEESFYKGIQGAISAKWDKLKDRNDRDAIMVKLLLMLRLRQISVHPQVYIDAQRMKARGYTVDDWAYSCTKFDHVKKMLGEFPSNEGTVVFCSFRKEIELFKAELSNDASVFVYYGGMTDEERSANINGARESVEAGKRTVMLVQINSGGTGLNLQFMNRVIFMSPWWTAALMDQAVGRVVRFGQSKQTYVYHVQIKQEEDERIMNIDRFVFKKVHEKRALCQRVLAVADHSC
jgi:transcription termination factor 2